MRRELIPDERASTVHTARRTTTEGGLGHAPTLVPDSRTIESEFELQLTLRDLALIDGAPPLRVGRDGRYAVQRILGRGGMGIVYLGEDRELGDREVAIKVVSQSRSGSGRSQLRLRREAWALALLDHPNVVRVYDVDTAASGELFIVMEYMRGQTLRQWVAEHEPQLPELLAVLVDAGHGLAAAHAKGLVHRDFKPDNVLIERAGARLRVLVSDFGLAGGPSLQGDTLPAALSMAHVHSTHALLGTPAYMSPEQRRRERVGPRSDQYAFCVSAWELVVGALPELEDQAPPQRPRALPRWLYRLLRRGLAHDPDQRFPDMPALLAAIEHTPRRRRAVHRALGVGVVSLGLGYVAANWAGTSASDPGEAKTLDPQVSALLNQALADEAKGEYQAARATAESALALAESTPRCEADGQHSRDEAAALLRLGYVLAKLGELANARASLGAAIEHATICDEPAVVVDARLRMTKLEALDAGDVPAASAHLEHAELLMERLDEIVPTREFERAAAAGALALARGQYSDAIADYRRAHAAIVGQSPVREIEALNNIAIAAELNHDVELLAATRAEIDGGGRSETEPRTNSYQYSLLQLNRGLAALASETPADAYLTRALGSPRIDIVVNARTGLIQSAIERGAWAQAREHADALLVLLSVADDLTPKERALALLYAGQALARDKRPEGVEMLDESARIWAQQWPDDAALFEHRVTAAWYRWWTLGDREGARRQLDVVLRAMHATDALTLDVALRKIEDQLD